MDNISFQGHTCLILNPKAYDKARVTTSMHTDIYITTTNQD